MMRVAHSVFDVVESDRWFIFSEFFVPVSDDFNADHDLCKLSEDESSAMWSIWTNNAS